MEKGKNGRQAILAAAAAVLIILCGAALIFLKIANSVPVLSTANGESAEVKTDITGEYVAAETKTAKAGIDGFEIKRNGEAVADVVTPKENLPEEGNTEGYICSYSSERQITEDDIQKLRSGTYEDLPEGKDVIQMAVNEMYARYGYRFSTKEIQDYFEKRQWYQDIAEKNSDMNAIYENMTEIEKENVDFLSSYRGE